MDHSEFARYVVTGTSIKTKEIPNLNLTQNSELFGFTDYVGITEVLEGMPSVETEEEVRNIANNRFEPYHQLDHSAVSVKEFTEDNKFWCEVTVNLSAISNTEAEQLAKSVGSAIEESFSR